MLIAQISDTHITTPDPTDPKFQARIEALTAFVAHINAMTEKPDCIIHTGDVTHGGKPEYYDVVKSVMAQIGVPVFFAVGNRDNRDNLVAGLKDMGGAGMAEGFVIYSVENFPVRLIAMDTQHREHNIGTTCSVRLNALDAMLKEQPGTPTALFMHHPPFEVTTASEAFQFQFDDKVLADSFLDLVSQHKQVVHMFCGHAHRPFRVDLETCAATVVPSLPADNRVGEYEPGLSGQPLFQLHRWNPDTVRFETTLHPAVSGLKGHAAESS